ncbi:MAG: hypothetical protein MK086_10655 [Flavobacteriales bacterium]|nr:hypothetical protein [Flavobacteriales bacterium]
MRTGLLAFILVLIFPDINAQKGYNEYQKVNGLEISTKWGLARDASGIRKDAILLKVQNTIKEALILSLDINLYYEGILRESGRIEDECIPGLKSRVGKLNGIYFMPENFTSEQLKNSHFSFSLDEIEVKMIEACDSN